MAVGKCEIGAFAMTDVDFIPAGRSQAERLISVKRITRIHAEAVGQDGKPARLLQRLEIQKGEEIVFEKENAVRFPFFRKNGKNWSEKIVFLLKEKPKWER